MVVRPPRSEDLDIVLTMWDELRQRSGRSGALAPVPSEARLRELLVTTLGQLPAEQGDCVCGAGAGLPQT